MGDVFQNYSGGEPYEPLPEPPSSAPALPTEGHIVAAALAVEKMKGLCEQMLLVLQHVPRDAAVFRRLIWEASDACGKAHESYEAYRAVLECKGQA